MQERKLMKKKKEPYEQVKIDEGNLTADQLVKLKELMKRKSRVFANKEDATSRATNITHSIDTGNHRPIHVPKYRVSFKDRSVVETHVKDMLRKNVIEPSKSPWAFPIVLLPKKDGSTRFCVD